MTALPRTVAVLVTTLALLPGCSRKPPGTPDERQPYFLSIDASCDSPCVFDIGSEWQFSAMALYGDGSRQAADAAWTSDDPAVASVDSSGRVRALGIGMTKVRASAGSLTASRPVQVVGKLLGRWKGEWVVRSCKATGRFDQEQWCAGDYSIGRRYEFVMTLREDGGRLSGGIDIHGLGGGLGIDEGTIDADGRLQLSAHGELALGAYLVNIDPLNAQIRGTLMEGRFVMKVFFPPDSGIEGEVILQADLDRVTLQ